MQGGAPGLTSSGEMSTHRWLPRSVALEIDIPEALARGVCHGCRVWRSAGIAVVLKATMFSNALRRRLRFHRLGILVAVIVLAVGIAFVAAALVRFNLLEALHGTTLVFVLGCALVVLGALSLAAYGVVRAIEWANQRWR